MMNIEQGNNRAIARLHFITQDELSLSHAEQAFIACQAGLHWVQYRTKNPDTDFRKAQALQVKAICAEHRASFIINDHVELAREIGAQGVHLGSADMSPQAAREILGTEAIIGATLNSAADLGRAQDSCVDYLGVGPYRFTATKKNLSPVLGAYGIRTLLKAIREVRPFIPVIAIGGITLSDLSEVLACGVNGVAVSSAISAARDQSKAAREFAEFFI